MTLYIENLIYLNIDAPSIVMSFENVNQEITQYANNASNIVKDLIKQYPEKINYIYNLDSFTVSYDLNFITTLLMYLMIEKDVNLEIDDEIVKIDKYDNDSFIKLEFLILEFCKKELLRINLMRKQQEKFIEDLNDLGNLTI